MVGAAVVGVAVRRRL
ncbi:hypothetical protein ACI2KC_01095 [Pseudomonas monteilii]